MSVEKAEFCHHSLDCIMSVRHWHVNGCTACQMPIWAEAFSVFFTISRSHQNFVASSSGVIEVFHWFMSVAATSAVAVVFLSYTGKQGHNKIFKMLSSLCQKLALTNHLSLYSSSCEPGAALRLIGSQGSWCHCLSVLGSWWKWHTLILPMGSPFHSCGPECTVVYWGEFLFHFSGIGWGSTGCAPYGHQIITLWLPCCCLPAP